MIFDDDDDRGRYSLLKWNLEGQWTIFSFLRFQDIYFLFDYIPFNVYFLVIGAIR